MSVERQAAVMKILDDQNHLSERADGKAISLLSMLGIFTVFFVSQIGSMKNMSLFMNIAVVVYFVSVLMSIIQIIQAISPRIRTVKHISKSGPKAKPIPQPTFFGGICKFPNSEEYKKCLDDVIKNDDEITDIYIKQIYEVAQINATKYSCVNRAVWFVVLALGSQLAIIAYIFATK
jgi:predicted RND superfamily exporter protein